MSTEVVFNVDKYESLTPKKKLEYLNELLKDKNFKDIFMKIYDREFKCGVNVSKKEMKKLLENTSAGDKCDYTRILQALDKLLSIRQGLRKEAIRKSTHRFTKHELYLLLAIVRKDLGIGYKQACKLVNNKELKYYPIMLAHKFTSLESIKNHVNDRVLLDKRYIHIQPKLDGMRLLYIPKDRVFVTRNQDVLNINSNPNLRYVIDSVDKIGEWISKYGIDIEDFVLDGEVFAGNWNDTMTIVNTKNPLDDEFVRKLNYYVFDLIPYYDFINFNFDTGIVTEEIFDSRYNTIMQYIGGVRNNKELSNNRNVKFIKSVIIDKDKLDINTLNSYMDLLVGKYNFEGAMIKFGDEYYYEGRKLAWLKLKPENELDAVIIDILEGDGRFANTCGALLCKSIINNKEITFKVGSGLTDELRDKIWQERDKLIGKIVEINYQELTKDNIPRFPIFKRFRFDKNSIM